MNNRLRRELVAFTDSNAIDAVAAQKATDEALVKYQGFIDRVSSAVAAVEGDRPGFDPEEIKEGFRTVAQFALWRAAVNRPDNEAALQPRRKIGEIDFGVLDNITDEPMVVGIQKTSRELRDSLGGELGRIDAAERSVE